MLVLSRKVNQRIFISDDIVLTVVEIRGDKVRFGIDAPENVVVVREELLARFGNAREVKGDEANHCPNP